MAKILKDAPTWFQDLANSIMVNQNKQTQNEIFNYINKTVVENCSNRDYDTINDEIDNLRKKHPEIQDLICHTRGGG